MIGSPTTLTTSCQRSRHFIPSSSIKNDTSSPHPFIADIRTIQKSIHECCGRIGHKADAYIIRGKKFLPPSIIININQFNGLHAHEPNEPPRKWGNQPTSAHFKPRNYPYNTIPVV